MRQLAVERDVPLVDFHAICVDYMRTNGYSKMLAENLYVGDTVHFTEKGANWIASNVAKQFKEIGLPLGDFIIE